MEHPGQRDPAPSPHDRNPLKPKSHQHHLPIGGSRLSALGVGSSLRAFTFGHVRQLDAVAWRWLVNVARVAPIVAGIDEYALVDIDETIKVEKFVGDIFATVNRLRSATASGLALLRADSALTAHSMVTLSSPPRTVRRESLDYGPWIRL